MQNKKSKYKVDKYEILLETEFLHPMIKGKNVTPFHVDWEEYIVPFPYDKENPRVPISQIELADRAPKLSQYYMKSKDMILAQTEYNEKIIGKNNAEFYALARVGEYSYAENYVVFRDNTKWAAAVITNVDTKWGGKKRPLFQNHAVSICEYKREKCISYISLDEAHYICGILNSKIVYDYMMQSSDSRSFPIRPRVKIPKYDMQNSIHQKIVKLSKEAHETYYDKEKIEKISEKLSELYLSII
jgi:hypothetical protein